MKISHFKYFFIGLSACSIIACTSAPSEQSETVAGISSPEITTESSTGSWLMALMDKDPLTEAAYLALPPDQLQGFPLLSKEPHPSLNGFIAFYAAKDGSDQPGIRLEVIDGAGNPHFQHANAVYKLLEKKRSESGDDFESEVKDHKGERVLVVSKTKNGQQNHQLEYLQNQRYHLGIIGNHVGLDQIYGAFEELQSQPFPS